MSRPHLAPAPGQPPGQARAIPTEVKDPDLVAKRRGQIVDAAVQLFLKKGFHKTTTREMAKAAGFSIGTLYEYVTSKEDVLYLVCQAIHAEVESRIKERLKPGGPASSSLAAAMEVYFTVCHQMSDHILLIYQETKSLPPELRRFVLAHEERITEIFADLLRRGVDDYSLKPLDRAQIGLMAHNITVLGHVWAFRRWTLSPRFSLSEYIQHQRDILLGQLA